MIGVLRIDCCDEMKWNKESVVMKQTKWGKQVENNEWMHILYESHTYEQEIDCHVFVKGEDYTTMYVEKSIGMILSCLVGTML